MLTEVTTQQTRNGNTRFVVRDSDGREYTTFRTEIGARAQKLQGSAVRIAYHEEQRGQYTNVYVDQVEPFEQRVADDIERRRSESSGN